MAKYIKYKAVVERISAGIKQAQKIAQIAIDREMNEAQTTDVVEDVLEKMLNFDRFEDRKPQFNIDGKSKNIIDILLELGDGIRIPIEIKQATLKLNDKHAGQLEDYAKLLGAEFGILTNGVEWKIIQYSASDGDVMVSEFNLIQDKHSAIADAIYVFSKEAIKGGHTHKQAELSAFLQAGNIADTMASKRVLSAIRLEMHDRHKVYLDEDDIRNVLIGEVIRASLLSPTQK